ncbi:MAG: hypothetical protein KDA96_08020 [Planctomycetaceae bacterium]|nr:hypothetical protein [Planctomycetaceae bacterium]
MMNRLFAVACLFLAAGVLASAQANEEKEAAFDAKCPVSGAAAKKDVTADYKEKKVHLCCDKCKAAFEKDSSKFVTRANHQLVHTKQYKQAKCPLSGAPCKKDFAVKVSETDVYFCCNNCKGKAAGASGDDQLALIFGEEPFKKGFEVVKTDN